jgi:hypothetical protein
MDESESGTVVFDGFGREAAAPVASIAGDALGDAEEGCVSGGGVLEGAGAASTGAGVLGDADRGLAGAGFAGREVLKPDEEGGRSEELRSIRGTISNARKSAAAAPITKNFNELGETFGSGTRRGAAMVTLTLGKEETRTREDGCVATLGETDDKGTERGSTFGRGAGLGEGETTAAALAAEACAATAKGGCGTAAGAEDCGAAAGTGTGFGLAT